MTSFPIPAPPVVGGIPKNHSGTDNSPPLDVVIHSAVIACEPGRARQLGEWNRDGTTAGSWHYAVDPAETIQCSYDRFVVWADGVNDRRIAIEMCDWPAPVPKTKPKQWWLSWRWARKRQRAMLRRTARLTAELCLGYGIPIRFVGVRKMRAGAHGITTHAVVTKVHKRSTHWDPGWWPRRRFMQLVRKYARQIREEAAHG